MLICSRAPLRLGLAGGGTDVSPYCDEFGGAILNATIGHYAYATLEPTTDDVVICLLRPIEIRRYPADQELRPDGCLDLLKEVHNCAVQRFNAGRPLSLRLTTRVDVPSGSGLGGCLPW